MDMRMDEAMALNAQLKALLLEAEQNEGARREPARKGAGRPAGPGGRGGGRGRGGAPRGATKGGWGGQTHTAERSNQIAYENAILVQKLGSVATGRSATSAIPPPPRRAVGRSSVAINRSRADDRIARENAAMAKRLATVKPTKSLSKSSVAKHDDEHARHLHNVSRTPVGAAPVPRAPSAGAVRRPPGAPRGAAGPMGQQAGAAAEPAAGRTGGLTAELAIRLVNGRG